MEEGRTGEDHRGRGSRRDRPDPHELPDPLDQGKQRREFLLPELCRIQLRVLGHAEPRAALHLLQLGEEQVGHLHVPEDHEAEAVQAQTHGPGDGEVRTGERDAELAQAVEDLPRLRTQRLQERSLEALEPEQRARRQQDRRGPLPGHPGRNREEGGDQAQQREGLRRPRPNQNYRTVRKVLRRNEENRTCAAQGFR